MKRAAAFLLAVLCLVWAPPGRSQDERLKDFWAACRNGDNVKVKEFLDAGLSPDARFDAGMTPLLAAVSRGQVETVKLLLARGADTSLRDDSFRLTPLGLAAFFGVTDAAVVLLPHSKEDMDVVLIGGVSHSAPPLVAAGLQTGPAPQLLTRALLLATRHDKPNPEIIAMLQRAGAKLPPTLTPEQLQRFTGAYENASKLDLEVALQEGKLLGSGGAGFEAFFEQELIPLAPDLLLLSSEPNTTFQFAGGEGPFARVKISIPGATYDLRRTGGGSQ